MNKKGKKMMFDDLANRVQLNEDTTQLQNKWTGAYQMSQRKQPQMMTMLDILAKERQGSEKNAQHPNNVRAPGPDIVGQSPLVQLLGDLMIQNEEIKKVIRKVHTSPVLTDNSRAKAQLNSIMNKLVAIDNIVKKAGEDIDKFKVEVTDA